MAVPESWSADLAQLHAAVASLSARAVAELEGPDAAEVHRRIRSAADQALALAARLLARVEEDGRWAVGGARTFPEWVATNTRASVGAARREATLGKALDNHLPATARAVGTGEISLEHAQVLARLAPTSEARRTALASEHPDLNEAALVAKGRRLGADAFGREVKRWAARVDSAAHEREHQAASLRERLVFYRRDNGVAFDGFLTVEHGEALTTALRAITGVPAADDHRASEERQAHALTALARTTLDRGLAGGRGQVRPHISVHVSWETFCELARVHAGDVGAPEGLGAPAELDNGEPIPPSVLARIACDSEITRIVFGPDSEPLDVGRAQRTFTGSQRRGVIARDRYCQYPGCDRSPMLCEVHHVAWWVRDNGPTAVENGILLCWHHHDLVHQRSVGIRRSAESRWEFRRTDGTVIRPPGERAGVETLGDGSTQRPPPPPLGHTPVPAEPPAALDRTDTRPPAPPRRTTDRSTTPPPRPGAPLGPEWSNQGPPPEWARGAPDSTIQGELAIAG